LNLGLYRGGDLVFVVGFDCIHGLHKLCSVYRGDALVFVGFNSFMRFISFTIKAAS
jgi:hypothetical protein